MTVHKRLDEKRAHTSGHDPHVYRVDILLNETGTYAEYTSRKQLVNEAMGRAFVTHLKRGGTGGRLVKIMKKVEEIVEEWERHLLCPYPTVNKDRQVWCKICHKWTNPTEAK